MAARHLGRAAARSPRSPAREHRAAPGDHGRRPVRGIRPARPRPGPHLAGRHAVRHLAAGGAGLLEHVLHRHAERGRDRVQRADRRLALARLDLGDEARRQPDAAGQAAQADPPPGPLRADTLADWRIATDTGRPLASMVREARARPLNPDRAAARSKRTRTPARGRRCSGARCRGASRRGPARTGTAARRRSPCRAPGVPVPALGRVDPPLRQRYVTHASTGTQIR